MALRETDTQDPILHNDKVPSILVSMDENHPVVKTYHLPLTERCRNVNQMRCQRAHECYGNASCSGKFGLRGDTLDFTNACDGNDFEVEGMCDAF